MKNEAAITEKQQQALNELLEKNKRGTFELVQPIMADDVEITELKYDFTKITGREYAEAMDSDVSSNNFFKITARQALALFALAAAKETKGVDMTDIIQRIGVVDARDATQRAILFLNASSRIR